MFETSTANEPTLAAVASHESGVSAHGTIVGKPSSTKLLWHQFSRQCTPGHRTVFSLKFTIGTFVGLSLMFLIGGGIILSQSLSLVQIRIMYSDLAPLATYSNEERSMLLQGQGVPQDNTVYDASYNVVRTVLTGTSVLHQWETGRTIL